MSADKNDLAQHLRNVISECVGMMVSDLETKVVTSPSKMCAELAVDAIEECEQLNRRIMELTILLDRSRKLLHNIADYHYMKRRDYEEPEGFGNGSGFDKHVQEFLDDSSLGGPRLMLKSIEECEPTRGNS